VNPNEEYPENHVAEDGTVVRYRWERDLTERERFREQGFAVINVRRLLLAHGPHSFAEIRESTLLTRWAIADALDFMYDEKYAVLRDGKVAS
jgi:hypothetical protein